MTLRFWRFFLVVLVALTVLGGAAWLLLLRPVAQASTNDPVQVFNHGSIGNETAQGIPYWIWRVLPKVFPEHLPGDGHGYASIGVHWTPGEPVPVGFSLKTVGAIPRVAPNCAFCHQGSYRLRPEDPAQLVSAGPGTRVDPQGYIRFLSAVGQDPRFTADRLMKEITAIYEMPLWERVLYRYLLIPATGKALAGQGDRFAWMDTRPDWGPGRIDPFNPVKFHNLALADDDTIGNSDVMPLWGLASVEPTANRRFSLHWDGLLTDLHETVVAGAIGDGMSHRAYPGVEETLATVEEFVRHNAPPPSPFSTTLPADDPFQVDPAAVREGRAIYQRECAECHEPSGARHRMSIPIVEVGTDRHRLDMWSVEARDSYAAYEPDYPWGFEHFEKTDGYVATDLSGLWLRGPYLHNGSVPNLRALLMRPENRPTSFWRGSDLVDTANGGFVSTEGADPQRELWRYDTTEPGNANSGHRWGTGLNASEKEVLLSYLKTL